MAETCTVVAVAATMLGVKPKRSVLPKFARLAVSRLKLYKAGLTMDTASIALGNVNIRQLLLHAKIAVLLSADRQVATHVFVPPNASTIPILSVSNPATLQKTHGVRQIKERK